MLSLAGDRFCADWACGEGGRGLRRRVDERRRGRRARTTGTRCAPPMRDADVIGFDLLNSRGVDAELGAASAGGGAARESVRERVRVSGVA